DAPEADIECRIDHLRDHLRWSPDFALRVVARASERGLVEAHGERLALRPPGRVMAHEAIAQM
ncbi:MAG TPA: hypothetical protein PKA05_15910, partial [Roseiflexaceae bacterium]|nr:hypothetical protein [Roseiflexaceae bacterium]